MGYQRATLKLVWPEDSELHGLEVRVRRLSIDAILDLLPMEGDETVNGIDYLTERMKRVLISWNLDDDQGVPLTADEAGIRRADPDLISDILAAARAATTKVAPPLPQPSADGSPTLEASMPMEILSESLPSSSVPA